MARQKQQSTNHRPGAVAVTVDEVIKALAENMLFESKYDKEADEWLLDVHVDGMRKQEITLSPFQEGGRPMVRLITAIGKASDFSPQKLTSALELNASLLYGALAIYQGQMVLTETFPLSRKDTAEINDVVQYMTRMADSYEKMLFGLDRA